MKYLNLFLILFVSACNSASAADLSKVKVGMSPTQVESVVGKPDAQKKIIMTIEHWTYGKGIVVFEHKKVYNVIADSGKTGAEIQNAFKDFQIPGKK